MFFYTPIKVLVFSIFIFFNIVFIKNKVRKLIPNTNKYLKQAIPEDIKNSTVLLTGNTLGTSNNLLNANTKYQWIKNNPKLYFAVISKI